MKLLLQNLDDYLTWHPEVLAYTGFAILGVTIVYCGIFLITF